MNEYQPLNTTNDRGIFCGILCMAVAVIAVFPITTAAQVNPQLIFDKGNEQFQSGNYTDALGAYRQLVNNEHISGSLFLNMGLSYIQLDSLGKAKFYLLKASRFDESRERAQRALEYVESNLSYQSAVLPKLPWEKTIDWIQNTTDAGTLLVWGIIFFNIGILTYVSTWFVESFPQLLKPGSWTAAVIGLLIISLSFYIQYVDSRYSKAVMVHRQTDVTEQPDSDAAVINQAYEGYTFTVDHFRSRSSPGWSYVRMSNGMFGWIPSSEIMVL